MSHTYYRCWIHLVWSTYLRRPLLTRDVRRKLFTHVKQQSIMHGYYLDVVNGVEDHIHCLYVLQPKHSISRMVNNIKGESSHWINEIQLTEDYFKWQDGYSVFTLSEGDLVRVRNYIHNQEAHHHSKTTIKEFEL